MLWKSAYLLFAQPISILKVIKYLHNTEHMLEIMYPSSIQSIQQYVSEYKGRRVLSSTVWIKTQNDTIKGE